MLLCSVKLAPPPYAQRGFSMIEVLVTLLIISLALLGTAGLQAYSMRLNQSGQFRTQAVFLVADLAERMRSNQAGLANYAVAGNFTAQATQPALTTACETYSVTACTSATLAAYDLATWQRLVRSQLPEGSVYVTPSTSTSVLAADVWVAWRDPAVAAPSENSTDARNYAKECPQSFSSDVSIRCSYFRINI